MPGPPASPLRSDPRIELLPHTEVLALDGDSTGLTSIRWRDRTTGREAAAQIRNLFLFIVADPASEWLVGCGVGLDKKGFIVTENGDATRHRGVFAIGDVRSGSVKRVGGAIGEGAAAVAEVHAYMSSA